MARNKTYPVDYGKEPITGPPTHPGEILAEVTFPALKLPIIEIAKHLRISRVQLHRVMPGKSPITPDLAGLWLRLQTEYDGWEAKQRLADELKTIPTLMPNGLVLELDGVEMKRRAAKPRKTK